MSTALSNNMLISCVKLFQWKGFVVQTGIYSLSMKGLQQNINRFCELIICLKQKLIHTNVNFNLTTQFLTTVLIDFLRTGKLSP